VGVGGWFEGVDGVADERGGGVHPRQR
jgi:hypothetical protein